MKSITDLVESYIEVRTRRQELEAKANDIKNGEEQELKTLILAEMAAQGMKSVHLEGVGRVTSRVSYHYEIKDMEKLSKCMFKAMATAIENGRPVSDGLLLQRRVSKEALENLIGDTVQKVNQNASQEDYDRISEYLFGVKNVGKNNLSITKIGEQHESV